jgi:alkylresorcinol/alkylpyrone synthase
MPVPDLAAEHAGLVFDRAMADEGLTARDIEGWILHAGGRRVLEQVRGRLGLTPDDTRESAAILLRYGNLSSPFVMFVLDEALRNGAGPGRWWMSSFGAGFSCHGALLEVA